MSIEFNADFDQIVDDVDPLSCPMDELQQLLDDAPSLYQMGYLAGIMLARTMTDAALQAGRLLPELATFKGAQ